MNQETNDYIKENLEEAHSTFLAIIEEMKEKNIEFAYKELETMESNSYEQISEKLRKMIYYVSEAKSLKEENKEMYEIEHGMYIKCISLYIVTLLFLRLYNEIFDTSELNDMIKYTVGLFLGSTYIGLLNKDIHDNRNGTKERRDLINRLKTMKEEYKKMHDEVVNEIDYIFAVNTNLWKELDKERVKVK